MALTPTPSSAAGLTEFDTTEPRVRTSVAIGVIITGYLMFFGTSVINAINIEWNDIVLRATDYSSYGGLYEFCGRLIGIGGALGPSVGRLNLAALGHERSARPRHQLPASGSRRTPCTALAKLLRMRTVRKVRREALQCPVQVAWTVEILGSMT